jgi:hypothetical protein
MKCRDMLGIQTKWEGEEKSSCEDDRSWICSCQTIADEIVDACRKILPVENADAINDLMLYSIYVFRFSDNHICEL